MFPVAPVGVGDSWTRTLTVKTPAPAVIKQRFTLLAVMGRHGIPSVPYVGGRALVRVETNQVSMANAIGEGRYRGGIEGEVLGWDEREEAAMKLKIFGNMEVDLDS